MPAAKRAVCKRPTIFDIAREAKVSTGTVSRALNNSGAVDPETRERVLAISRRLGIRPRSGKRSHFAIVVPAEDQTPGGFVEGFIYELIRELSVHGSALSAFTDMQIDNLRRWIFDGVFVATWSQRAREALADFDDTPVIGFNRFHDRGSMHVVGWDHAEEGRLVADYLLKKGHKRLAFVVAPPANEGAARLRLNGFSEECARAGYPLADQRVELLEDSAYFYAALQRVVQQKADAIFVPGHGRYGVEAIAILQNLMGLKVPEDISIVASESPGWSAITAPPLTTVHTPLSELAARAVQHMYALVAHRPPKAADCVLRPVMIERKSALTRGDA